LYIFLKKKKSSQEKIKMKSKVLYNREKEKLSIVKIGGNIVDNPAELQKFLIDFNMLKGLKILIHGGGAIATKMAEQLGIETKKVQGRRITDSETLKLVTMVYAGLINKNIVASLQSIGCNAIGLTGADANCIPSIRRSPEPVDFGFVGDPDPQRVNKTFIVELLENASIPVFCAITHDGEGSLLNTNADTIAYTVASALSDIYKATLYYCFEKEGVLMDLNNPESLIETIDIDEYNKLIQQGVIADGMIPKLFNSFNAISQGVSEVIILHAKNLLTGKGTKLI
jgi:acetylglutamate kinase